MSKKVKPTLWFGARPTAEKYFCVQDRLGRLYGRWRRRYDAKVALDASIKDALADLQYYLMTSTKYKVVAEQHLSECEQCQVVAVQFVLRVEE